MSEETTFHNVKMYVLSQATTGELNVLIDIRKP